MALTTLGYGDVVPVTPETRSLAIIEPTAGVLYRAVLVAWLVGAPASPDADRFALASAQDLEPPAHAARIRPAASRDCGADPAAVC